jgi:hypothetical protein
VIAITASGCGVRQGPGVDADGPPDLKIWERTMNTQANEVRPLNSAEIDAVSGGAEKMSVAIPFINGLTIVIEATKDYAVISSIRG